MALSPVDFAAYSRATGAPYPESPEEKARMVPEVRAFRAGQLQQGESGGENNLLTGIGIGLGLLGAAGTGLALRGRRIPKMDPSGKGGIKVQANPSADKVFDLERAATQPLNTKKVLDERANNPVLREAFLNSKFGKDAELAKNIGISTDFIDSIPSKGSDFPGTATKDSGFREFSQKADDITGRDEVLNLIADEQEQAMRTRMEPPDANDFLSDRVDQLISEVEVGPAGEMLAGPEVAAEARQMMGTESSRQSAAVNRAEREEASEILAQLKAQNEVNKPKIKEVKITTQEASPAPDTLTDTYETFGEPAAQAQNIDAVQSASDQLDSRVEAAVQRDANSVRTGKQQRLFRDFGVNTSTDLEVVGQQLQTDRYSDKRFNAQDLTNSSLDLEEINQRILSAASQPAGSLDEQLLLNPSTPINQLRQRGLLGSTPKFDPATGRVESNPTFELAGGASVSMGDRPGKARKNIATNFDDEGASSYGDFYGSAEGDYVDLDTSAGIEGSAYLKETKGYTERTNKGQTFLAGEVEELVGSMPDSLRQERILDEFVPTRQIGGEESPGITVDQSRGPYSVLPPKNNPNKEPRVVDPRLRLQGGDKGTKQDINVEGSKLIGNFAGPETTPYFQFDDQVGVLVSDQGFITPTIRGKGIKDLKTAQTIPLTGRYSPGDDRLTTQPYMLFDTIDTNAGERSVKRPLYGPLLETVTDKQGKRRAIPVAVSRSELDAVASRAAEEFKDPAVQRAYLGAVDPDYLKTQGTGAIDIRPFDRTGYIAMQLDQAAKNPQGSIRKGRALELPVLSDPSAKHRFVSDITSTNYDSQEYGKIPFKKGAKSEPTGTTQRKGFGGVDPMQLDDASTYDAAAVEFFTPRIEGGESKTPLQARPSLAPATATGSALAGVRSQLANVQPPKPERFQPKPRPDSIEDITGQAMTQLLAQANRRRGARRS